MAVKRLKLDIQFFAGITHLVEFQQPALRALVDLTEADVEETFADQFLPTVETDSRTFAFDIVKSNEYIAAYIGFGAEPPYIDRDVLSKQMGTIAYFGLGDIVTYEELQAIHEARNNREKANVVERLVNKNIKILNGLRKLIYLAKMEALFKGTHTFTEADGEKNQITFEFGIPAENKIALTGDNTFANDEFDIVGFLLNQVKAYRDANQGRAPEVMVGSYEIQALMLRNKLMIIEAGRPEGAIRINVDQMNSVLQSFGLPRFTVIEEREISYKRNGDNAHTVKEIVPANRITFLSSGIGEYLLGPTLENGFRPGLFLKADDLDHPLRSVLQGFGAGFPTPTTPSLIFHIDVYVP